MRDPIEKVDRLKKQLDALRPLPLEVIRRIEQKLRIESNYHSKRENIRAKCWIGKILDRVLWVCYIRRCELEKTTQRRRT